MNSDNLIFFYSIGKFHSLIFPIQLIFDAISPFSDHLENTLWGTPQSGESCQHGDRAEDFYPGF
jgi:hypothetical protein